jgi:glycosyltransferase involved in cell wall biosynthesis
MTRISIVIPCYKQAHFLTTAIESCLRQDYPDFEIIVVNDCSPDPTREVATKFGTRIIYVEHPVNRGLSAARNSGIAQASGEFIAFLDSDDLMLPGRLRLQAAALQQAETIGLCACAMTFIDEAGTPLATEQRLHGPPKNPRNFRWEIASYPVLPSQVMVRKECFARVGAFDERFLGANGGEDWLMWVRISATYDMVYLHEPLTAYRRHTQQATASSANKFAPQNRLASKLAVESPLFSNYPAHFRAQLLYYRFATTWREEPKLTSLAHLWRAFFTDPTQIAYGLKVIGLGIHNTIKRRMNRTT